MRGTRQSYELPEQDVAGHFLLAQAHTVALGRCPPLLAHPSWRCIFFHSSWHECHVILLPFVFSLFAFHVMWVRPASVCRVVSVEDMSIYRIKSSHVCVMSVVFVYSTK
jgi:hypothetical protein